MMNNTYLVNCIHGPSRALCVLILFCFGPLWSSSSAKEKDTGVFLTTQISGPVVNIKLTNKTNKSIEFYNSLTARRWKVPPLTFAQVKNSDGQILTKSDLAKDGYWTPLFLYSDLLESPLPMTTLEPGASVTTQVLIKELLVGTDPGLSQPSNKIRVKCEVFLDPSGGCSIKAESAWAALP